MSRFDTSQIHRSSNGNDSTGDDPTTESGQIQINTEGTDELLDDIDELLEEDAEEYVNAYVQKGGE